MSDSNVSRRDFIQKAAIFTGAGLAIGGAVAIGKEILDNTSQATPVDVEALQSQVTDSTARLAQLQQALTTAESELATLRPNYAAALSKNTELQNALSTKQQEVDSTKATLAEVQARLDKLAQLVAMYEKLDNNQFDALVQGGLGLAGAGFAGALGTLPLVSEGVSLARSLLDGFEFQIPNFRAGVSWLQKRMDEMTSNISAVEKAIQQALTRLDPVKSKMAQLITHILAYLPSHIGAGVKGALDAIHLLYQLLPPVIVGTHDQVVNMLTEPFAESEKGLSHTLVKPIRERSLVPAETLAAQVKTLNDVYTRDLQGPVKQALDRRAGVLKEIADFKAANQF